MEKSLRVLKIEHLNEDIKGKNSSILMNSIVLGTMALVIVNKGDDLVFGDKLYNDLYMGLVGANILVFIKNICDKAGFSKEKEEALLMNDEEYESNLRQGKVR